MKTEESLSLPFDSLSLDTVPQIIASEPSWHWNTTIPNYYNLWVTLEGVGTLATLGKVYELHPGTSFLLIPGQKVSATHDSSHPIRNFTAHLLLPKSLPSTIAGVVFQELTLARELCSAIVRTSRHRDGLARQQCEGLCYQLLAQLWRDAHSPALHTPDAKLLRAAERMVECPWDWQSIPLIAKETGYSIAQFNRRFTVLIGQSPARYAIAQRIRRAKELLEQSSMQVGEIAEALGYQDIYYFSRQFKNIVGHSPQTHRILKSST